MTDDIKASILVAHNLRRNRVAKGEIAGFDSVSRMPTMVSDLQRFLSHYMIPFSALER
jgi:hypothetical protein